MPQLDKLTFLPIVFWTFVIYSFGYLFLSATFMYGFSHFSANELALGSAVAGLPFNRLKQSSLFNKFRATVPRAKGLTIYLYTNSAHDYARMLVISLCVYGAADALLFDVVLAADADSAAGSSLSEVVGVPEANGSSGETPSKATTKKPLWSLLGDLAWRYKGEILVFFGLSLLAVVVCDAVELAKAASEAQAALDARRAAYRANPAYAAHLANIANAANVGNAAPAGNAVSAAAVPANVTQPT